MATQARGIKLPVGNKGVNMDGDVRLVKLLMNKALDRYPKFKETGIAKLSTDGKCDENTINAIKEFQKTVLGWSGNHVDGTVHPNKRTWKGLNGNVPSTDHIAPKAEPRPPKLDGFSAFRQGEYASTKLGEGKLNIAGHGCALCTLTMAATAIGSPTKDWPADLLPRDLTPPIVNDILRKAGVFDGSLLVMGRAAEALGMSYDEYGMRPTDWNDKLSADEVLYIESNLIATNPVAANVDYRESERGDHWILITKRFGDGTFGCIDPATGRALKLTKSPPPANVQKEMKRDLEGGVLFGWGQGGSGNQQKYVVKRFALLAPASGGYCAEL